MRTFNTAKTIAMSNKLTDKRGNKYKFMMQINKIAFLNRCIPIKSEKSAGQNQQAGMFLAIKQRKRKSSLISNKDAVRK